MSPFLTDEVSPELSQSTSQGKTYSQFTETNNKVCQILNEV